jgi:peptide deformylase
MIITNDEAALRVKCEDATIEEVGPIIALLEQELEHSAKLGRPGIGLACPQIGIAKNVAIVRIDNLYKVNLVNCRIKEGYDKTLFKEEGCLSFPNRVEDTMRYQEICVVDNLVEPYSFVAAGLFSVVVQHELDHLNGILLPDIALAKSALPTTKYKLGPNDRCLCGKFDPPKKYKKCCGR